MDNPFSAFLDRYREDPVLMCQEVLGVDPHPWQQEVLRDVAAPRSKRLIATKSSHGVGKSATASWLIIWFLITRYPCKIVVTAPTQSQLQDALASEVKRWIKTLPEAVAGLFEVKAERIELKASPTEAFCSFRVARSDGNSSDAMQGVHSDHVLLIADEASGVPDSVFLSAGGSMSGENAHMILFGNPTRGQGYFYDCFHKLKDRWQTYTVSCYDSPLVSEEFIEDMAARFGDTSNVFRARCLGEFPLAEDDTVVSLADVEAATNRQIHVPDHYPIIMACDIARFGDDATVIVLRQGRKVLSVQSHNKLDLMQTSGRIFDLYQQTNPQPAEILIDSIGMGSGVLDRLRELGLPARGINVSESPSLTDRYANLRAELWFKLRDWFQEEVQIPNDDRLVRDLVATKYNYRSNGTLAIESKNDTKKRLGKSPDFADALMISMGSLAVDAQGRYRRLRVRTSPRRVANVC